jgi:hypothetical protein
MANLFFRYSNMMHHYITYGCEQVALYVVVFVNSLEHFDKIKPKLHCDTNYHMQWREEKSTHLDWKYVRA